MKAYAHQTTSKLMKSLNLNPNQPKLNVQETPQETLLIKKQYTD